MTSMSDAPYNKANFHPNIKHKNIANIHIDMYQYVQSTIVSQVSNEYFNYYYAEYYVDKDDLEKCRWYLYCADEGFQNHILNPIADVALEIFRYEHPNAIQAEFPFGNEREFRPVRLKSPLYNNLNTSPFFIK